MVGTAVLRGIASSVLSLLVVATFLWGGCVSCEQFFMFPRKQQNCCNKSGQCERPGKNSPKPETRDCNRLPLERGNNVHVVQPPALLPAVLPSDIAPPGFTTLVGAANFEPPPDPSPPDLQVLNSTFLI